MSHYFENDKNLQDHPVSYGFDIQGKNFLVQSNTGVFSSTKLDTGTKILLETVLKMQEPCSSLLDLGCGIGVVGLVMKTFWPECKVTLTDINERAAELARKNLKTNHLEAEVLSGDGIQKGMYSCILLNPPIRAGKETIYSLFDQCKEHLESDGSLWIVMRKQHGASSAISYLNSIGMDVERVARDKGFWILKAVKE